MKKIFSGPIKIAILSQLAALGLHFYLTLLHYGLRQGSLTSSAVCSINEKLNCEAVTLSPYSVLFDIPIAVWGLIVNLSILLLILNYIIAQSEENPSYRWAFTLSLTSLVASLVMGAISILKLDTFCIFCISLYALSIVTFYCLLVQKISPKKLIRVSDFRVSYLILLAAIPAASWVVNDMNTRTFDRQIRTILASDIESWIKNPVRDFSGLTGLRMGATDNLAKFVIYEFADFQCIHCKHAAPMFEAFVLANKNVQLNFFPFPLDGKCNPAISEEGDGDRCVLAKAALCAEQEGKGWKVHKRNFDLFHEPDSVDLNKMAHDVGLDVAKLKTCIESAEISQKIKELGNRAKVDGVEATPTVFVNGKLLPNGNILPILENLYQQINKN